MCLARRLLLLSVLIPAFNEAFEKLTLCRNSAVDIWGSYCGRKNRAPTIDVHSCDFSKKGKNNFTISWIPRFDVNDMYWKLTTWLDGWKAIEKTYVLCSGEDSEYEFCGNVKGETITVNILRNMYVPLLEKRTYKFDFQGFIDGHKHEDLCFEGAITIKTTL